MRFGGRKLDQIGSVGIQEGKYTYNEMFDNAWTRCGEGNWRWNVYDLQRYLNYWTRGRE